MENNVITDVQIPFTRLVVFLIKLGLAAIPAAIILTLLWMIFGAMFFGLIGMIGSHIPSAPT